MKQFVLGAVSMLVALVLAVVALVWSVGSPGLERRRHGFGECHGDAEPLGPHRPRQG